MPKHRLCSSVCSAKDKTLVTRELICSRKHHDFEEYTEHQSTKARLSQFFRKLLGLDLFYVRFKGAVIDNDQLTNSLRLQYLKSAVKGEASKMLTSITVTDDNFDVAMEILQNPYDNRRLILRAHIHGIVSYRPVSQENTRELRKLVDTMEEHRHSLRNMGQPVDHQDPFFVYLIAEKLPTETRKFWELSSKRKEL